MEKLIRFCLYCLIITINYVPKLDGEGTEVTTALKKCNETSECSQFQYCDQKTKKCDCKGRYKFDGEACILASVNGSCQEDSQCKKNEICGFETRQCICKEGFTKYAQKYCGKMFDYCSKNVNCFSDMAFCDFELSKCKCPFWTDEIGNFCLVKLGFCESHSSCISSSQRCDNATRKCVYSGNKMEPNSIDGEMRSKISIAVAIGIVVLCICLIITFCSKFTKRRNPRQNVSIEMTAAQAPPNFSVNEQYENTNLTSNAAQNTPAPTTNSNLNDLPPSYQQLFPNEEANLSS